MMVLIKFGMDINLDPQDMLAIEDILRPLHSVLTLRNDFDSWEKEQAEARPANLLGQASNAVDVFIQHDKVTVEEAKQRVRQLTLDKMQQFFQLQSRMLSENKDIKEDILRFVDAMIYLVTGHDF